MNLDLSDKDKNFQLSRDIFIFSYLCGGINMTDICDLKDSDIINNKLVYTRNKTNTIITIPLCEQAIDIINNYKNYSDYLFPFLGNKPNRTKKQIYERKRKVIGIVNKDLKEIANILDIKENLTTYVARHSYATILKNSGVNISLISETLGHTDLKTTQIYLDSFSNEQIDRALKNLM